MSEQGEPVPEWAVKAAEAVLSIAEAQGVRVDRETLEQVRGALDSLIVLLDDRANDCCGSGRDRNQCGKCQHDQRVLDKSRAALSALDRLTEPK